MKTMTRIMRAIGMVRVVARVSKVTIRSFGNDHSYSNATKQEYHWLKSLVKRGKQNHAAHAAHILLCTLQSWKQRWRSGKSTRLPPMWPRFDSQTQCHKWVGFVLVL